MTTAARPPDLAALAGARVLVLGLGRAGTAAARFLLGAGARVAGFDEDGSVLRGETVRELARDGLTLTRRPGSAPADWVIASPGISEEHPLVRRLAARGRAVIDELDFASRFVSGPVVAVTGTNGKSTTVALVGEMLRAAGKRVFVGGNLAPGRPLSAALALPRRDCYVVEVSSFQLERARWFAPHVAVLLNITPDHMNRHRTMARYAASKFRILDRQAGTDWAVLNRDDPVVMRAAGRGRARRRLFSMRRRVPGAYRRGGRIWYDGRPVASEEDLRLPGRHNVANALAAVCVARALGIGNRAVRRALGRFRGLPHRLELVARRRGVSYVNNSMCTNPAAGVASLRAFRRRVVLIAGGREKGMPAADYVAEMARRAKRVFLVGENRLRLARQLARLGSRRHEACPDLATAVRAAGLAARTGDTVLFSPGFASFDQYRDFEQRGEAFRREVARVR